MKITKRVRDEAALICAVAASNGKPISISHVVEQLDRSIDDAAHLAVKAWDEAHVVYRCEGGVALEYAEAEAMLRTGWEPS